MSRHIPAHYTPDTKLLAGRCILVTGAGDGLGRATAIGCARHGANVVLLGRTVKKLENVYDQIEREGGASPAIYPLNLAGATWKDYGDLADTIEREYGTLDGLVHCAAHFKQFAPLDGIDAREWVESLQVNLSAAYALTRHCMPLLLKSSDASVVFVSDAGGREPKPFQAAYGVSKAAIESLAASWAQELETTTTLRMNTFNPGPMRSAIRLRGFPGEMPDKNPPPDAVVPKLLWLLGPDSKGVTGCAL